MGVNEEFVAKGEVIKFEGFLKVYLEGSDDENEDDKDGILPQMKIGDNPYYVSRLLQRKGLRVLQHVLRRLRW